MSRRRLIPVFLLVVLLAFMAMGPEWSCSTANLSEFTTTSTVEDVTFKPTGPADVFKPDTPRIYVTTKLSNAPSDSKVKFDWYYMEGGETFVDGVEVNAEGTRYVASNLSLTQLTQWPEGKYEVRIFLDNKEVKRVQFTVKK